MQVGAYTQEEVERKIERINGIKKNREREIMEESSKTAVLVRSVSAPTDVRWAFLPLCHTVALRLVFVL